MQILVSYRSSSSVIDVLQQAKDYLRDVCTNIATRGGWEAGTSGEVQIEFHKHTEFFEGSNIVIYVIYRRNTAICWQVKSKL